jgi:phage/plasmid primase-like uncharacterized protein
MNTHIEDFKNAMSDAGITPPDHINPDGQRHRFKNEGDTSANSWYQYFPDGIAAGNFGCWKLAINENWCSKSDNQLTPDERRAYREQRELAKQQTEKERKQRHKKAADKAKAIYEGMTSDNVESHPYWVKKEIQSIEGSKPIKRGAWIQRGWNDALIIPLINAKGEIVSLQAINEKPDPNFNNKDKDFLAGGEKSGAFYPMTNGKLDINAPILIGEGIATLWAAKHSTGIQAIAAMDAGNLLPVARAIREKAPNAKIIFIADNDIYTDKKPNTGVLKAIESAKAIGGYVAIPELPSGQKCDCWDFWYQFVSDGVKAMIANATDYSTPQINPDFNTPQNAAENSATAPMNNTTNAPPMTDTHNAILDDEQKYSTVDFLKFVDDRHLLKQLALSIAKATDLPAHTVFLVGLGVFASVACRRWRVDYRHSGSLPISLYVVAEQPSGTSKSRTMNAFQKPFYTAEKEAKDNAKKQLSDFKKREKEARAGNGEPLTEFEYLEMERLERIAVSVLFATNATPEALEQSLNNSNGFFSAVSSEQGLFNTMLGACYGTDKVSNNDLLLNGYDGGYIASMRIGRNGYTGVVVGGAVMFAQSGGIENLLKASNGTGLAERFLMIAEPHSLGKRDHDKAKIINHDLIAQYTELCTGFCQYILDNPKGGELSSLDICPDGWQLIKQFVISIEHHLADGGRYSHIALRGAAAKVDMQIMKIAANLHLLDDYQNKSTTIELKHVESAIGIAHAMLEANLKLCTDKGIIGVRAEYISILSLFEYGKKSRTEREIINAKEKTAPFKDFTGDKPKLIRATLTDMVASNLLQVVYEAQKSDKRKPIKLYSLAQ